MSRPLGPRGLVLFAFGVAIGLYLSWLLRDVLVVIYVSALFAVVLMPLVRGVMMLHVKRWHPGRGTAVLLILLLTFGSLTFFIVVALAPAFRDLREFFRELPKNGPAYFARMQEVPLLRDINMDALQEKIQDFVGHSATYAVKFASDWAATAVRVIAGMVLTIYFIIEGDEAYAWFLSLFPVERRLRLDQTLARASVRMGRWLLGQGALMAILGVCSTVVFALLHVRYAYALGVIMGLFNIVPVAGAMVSMSLVVVVASLDSWSRVLGVSIFFLIYLQIENSWLTPRIMRTQVDLAGLTILIALLIGSALAGIIGAMVAVPTAVLVSVILQEYAVHEEAIIEEPHPVRSTQITVP
jgi:predicted PurR-regulated permease PerM